jgi:predicted  nucleic acid-binding Zn-ribbon protein
MSRLSKVAPLYQLQQLDTELERGLTEAQAIAAALRDDAALRQATQALEEAQQTLKQRQQTLRVAEQELSSLEGRLKSHSDRLYSGAIANPRELGALQQETQHLRELRSAQEDRVLEAMSAVEEAQTTLTSRSAEHDRLERVRQQEHGTLLERQQQAEARLTDLRQRRQQQAGGCDPALLQRYEQIRKAHGGKAVVLAEHGTCQGCRVALTASDAQRLRTSAEVITCNNCGRMLYLP